MWNRKVRGFVENEFPEPARLYRYLRDNTKRYKIQHSKYGFDFHGTSDLDLSRTNSNESSNILRAVLISDFFIDIGANIGYFSLLARNAKNLRVLSIEPAKRNLFWLMKNIKLNSLDIEVIPCAIGEFNGVTEIFGDGQGASREEFWAGISNQHSKEVKIRTLDSFGFQNNPQLNFCIKIDVEGFEYEIIKGAPEVLRLSNVCIFFENGFTRNIPENFESKYFELFYQFWDNDFVVYNLETLLHLDRDNLEAYTKWNLQDECINYVAFRQGSVYELMFADIFNKNLSFREFFKVQENRKPEHSS
jgi:hypothetical protein